jgi:hypothetical protein
MAQTQNQVAAAEAAGAQAGARQQDPAARGRVVFLNALPLNALPRRHIQVDILPVSLSDLAAWAQRRAAEGYVVEHYIRHGATLQALRSLRIPLSPEPSTGLYVYQPNDIIVVVTLRNPSRGQEQTQVRPEDLESWIVTLV